MSAGIDAWPAMPGPTYSPYVVVTDGSGNVGWTAAGRGIPDPNAPAPGYGGAASSLAFAGGHLVAGGIQGAPIDFGAGALGVSGNLFAAALDEPGTIAWQKSDVSIGGGLLASDGADRIVVAADTEAGQDFEGVSCTSGWCIVLATFDANGAAGSGHMVSASPPCRTPVGNAVLVSGAAFGRHAPLSRAATSPRPPSTSAPARST